MLPRGSPWRAAEGVARGRLLRLAGRGLVRSAENYPNLLQAFARVAAEEAGVALLIAGDGPLRPAAEELF